MSMVTEQKPLDGGAISCGNCQTCACTSVSGPTQGSVGALPSAEQGFWKRLRSWLHLPSEREQMEAYLAQSTDIYDLEARMRAWDSKERQKNISSYWYQ